MLHQYRDRCGKCAREIFPTAIFRSRFQFCTGGCADTFVVREKTSNEAQSSHILIEIVQLPTDNVRIVNGIKAQNVN
jgi:hypothetical protein